MLAFHGPCCHAGPPLHAGATWLMMAPVDAPPPARSSTACPPIIAIDGPAASGKSTVGRALAQRLGYRFIDTGLMYRAVTLLVIEGDIDISDESAIARTAESADIEVGERVYVDGRDVTRLLHSSPVTERVSFVSQISPVRRAMVALQRRIAEEGRIVMAGRDIGTVVAPHAKKVYLDAPASERVRRRHAELEDGGRTMTVSAVRAELEQRDRLDSQRCDSPLKAAEDAVVVDTSGLNLEQVVDAVLQGIAQE